jgi:flagellin
MFIGFNFGSSSSAVISKTNSASRDVALSQERISSGLRINSARDDAAGLAIVTHLSSEINGLGQARRNVSDASSYLQTGAGALATMTDNLQRMRELSVQASNGILNGADRQAIQSEIDSLTEEVFRISDNTTFNGISVLNHDSDLQFQVGNLAGQTVSASAGNVSDDLASLGLDQIDVSSAEAANRALGTLDAALNSLSTGRSDFGALQNRLDGIASDLESRATSSSASRSQIQDSDIAMEVSRLISAQLRQQAGLAMQVQANSNSGSVLRLLSAH